ncbi:MAG: aldo/keto reductase [Candidatus Aminicenantes bacterium]|nr:aldo/keto reductase [Candidatus Aminicenantes bacterium]
MDRRTFFRRGAAGVLSAAGLLGARLGRGAQAEPRTVDLLPRRTLGRTGIKLSILGLGGMAIARETPADVKTLVGEAFDTGVNYYDVAPTYADAEDLLGPALEPYRSRVHLACKTTKRDKDGARRELETSLRKLRTDYVDLYQFHALTTTADVEAILGPNGALETFVAAKQEGKVRFIGFSAHSEEAALLALSGFVFDTILFPVNYVCVHQGDFGPRVIQKAQELGIGILAIKAMAQAPWAEGESRASCPKCWYRPVVDPEEQALALRYTLSQPVTAAVAPGDKALFRRALALARDFQPLNEAETEDVGRRAAAHQPLFRAAKTA